MIFSRNVERSEDASHDGSVEQTFYDLDTELSYHCHPGFVRQSHQEAEWRHLPAPGRLNNFLKISFKSINVARGGGRKV